MAKDKAKGPGTAKHKPVPRHTSEADRLGHAKIKNLQSALMAQGVHLSTNNAKPGDVAWVGPCVNGNRIVCYYDQNMDPSDCRNQSC